MKGRLGYAQATPTMPISLEPYAVSIKDACILLGNRSPNTVYGMLAKGELEAVKDGTRTLIVTASIRARQEALPRFKSRVSAG